MVDSKKGNKYPRKGKYFPYEKKIWWTWKREGESIFHVKREIWWTVKREINSIFSIYEKGNMGEETVKNGK